MSWSVVGPPSSPSLSSQPCGCSQLLQSESCDVTGMLYCHYKTLSSVLSNVEVYSGGGPTSRPRQKISRVDSAKKATHQIMELLVLFAQPLWCCLASLVTLCRRPEMCQEFFLQSKRCFARRASETTFAPAVKTLKPSSSRPRWPPSSSTLTSWKRKQIRVAGFANFLRKSNFRGSVVIVVELSNFGNTWS